MGKKKNKKDGGNVDAFERMNFLYQASHVTLPDGVPTDISIILCWITLIFNIIFLIYYLIPKIKLLKTFN